MGRMRRIGAFVHNEQSVNWVEAGVEERADFELRKRQPVSSFNDPQH